MTKAFRIRDWGGQKFEKADHSKCKKMWWVAIPNSFDGSGFRWLISREDGAALYGAWILLVHVASRMPERGLFVRDGRPIGAEEIAVQTGAAAKVFERAFIELADPRVAWIEEVDLDVINADPHSDQELSGSDPEGSGSVPEDSRLQDKTPTRSDKDSTEQNPTPTSACEHAVGSENSVSALPDRLGDFVVWRNRAVLDIVRALRLDGRRALCNRRPIQAVLRDIHQRADRDALLSQLVEAAQEKANAGLDNPAAAWQVWVDSEFRPNLAGRGDWFEKSQRRAK